MKSPNFDLLCCFSSNRRLKPFFYLTGSLIGEGNYKDLVRIDVVFEDHLSSPFNNNLCLATLCMQKSIR